MPNPADLVREYFSLLLACDPRPSRLAKPPSGRRVAG